jgi:hypothetical protein
VIVLWREGDHREQALGAVREAGVGLEAARQRARRRCVIAVAAGAEEGEVAAAVGTDLLTLRRWLSER